MLDNLLIMKCTIQTRTSEVNNFGEPVYSWANTYTNVLCRFSSPKGSMKRLPSGEFVEDMPKIFLKPNQTISENNRIVGTSGFEDTYEVLKVNKRYNGNTIHHIDCELRKVI